MKRTSRGKDVKSQGEIAETVERSAADMQEKGSDLEKIQQDVQTVRDTVANLDFGGTSEGADAVESAMTGAEEATVAEFDREDEELERIHSESDEYGQELQEHTDAEQSDLGKISEASSRIDTNETINELVKAKEAVLRDVDFLAEQVQRARQAREDSEKIQQGYQGAVHGTRK